MNVGLKKCHRLGRLFSGLLLVFIEAAHQSCEEDLSTAVDKEVVSLPPI
jgi:hypothetical protein